MSILDKILESKKEEIKNLKKKFSASSFEGMELFSGHKISFIERTKNNKSISLICEIKKASPSKGIIRNDFNYRQIAEIYFRNDIEAVSVLTDKIFFQGDIIYLREIAENKKAPLLRKDFIIDELQVYESKANGADLILLISEVLSKTQINEFTDIASRIGLDVLLEVHSEDQLEKINFDMNYLIGINNRNLKDFSVSLGTTSRLRKLIPPNVFVVSESGISNHADVLFLKNTGVNALLVGESIMTEKGIENKIREFKKWCSSTEGV